jgi:hypothetical protein
MKKSLQKFTWILGCLAALSLACSLLGQSAPTERPSSMEEQTATATSAPPPVQGEALRISQRIEAASGGTMELTNSQGDIIRLEIPPFALKEPADITLTALGSVPANPISNNFFAGVSLQPEGLILRLPATLSVIPITAPAGFPLLLYLRQPDQVLPLYQAKWDGEKLTGRVSHFSTILGGSPSAAEAQAQAQAAERLGGDSPPGSQEHAEGTQALGEWGSAMGNMGMGNEAQDLLDKAKERLEDEINCLFDPNCGLVPLDPCGDYLQKLMQYFSQATRLGFDPESEMMTNLYGELERVLNECTNRYTLEYNHRLKVDQMGVQQEFLVTGKVLFTAPIYGVFDLGEPLKFEGSGPVDVAISGQMQVGDETCTISGEGKNQVTIGGEMGVDEYGSPLMNLKLSEIWYTTGQMTFTCPDGESKSVPLPGQENKEVPLTIIYQDGAVTVAPNLGGMQGEYRWILHIIYNW